MILFLRKHRVAVLLLLAAIAFLPVLGRREIVTSHEARVALVARQMAASGWPWHASRVAVPQVHIAQTAQGERLTTDASAPPAQVNPWLVPVMNGMSRLQKPPLPYWCAAVCDLIFGDRESSARLVPALLGALAVWFMWDWSRLLIGSVGAWYAGLIWVSSYFIVDEYRKAMADPYLAFFTLLSLWAWTRAIHQKKSRNPLLVFYCALALGVLAKGPIILLYVPVLLTVYHLCYLRRMPRGWMDHALGCVAFLAIAAPWPLMILLRVPHAAELWRYESIGSFSDNAEKARGWWFYLPNLFQLAIPWTPLWIVGMVLPFTAPRSRRRGFAWLGIVVVVFIFSLSFVKKNAYLLPLMPIQTLLIAQVLVRLTVWLRRRPSRLLVWKPMLGFGILAAALCVATQLFLTFYLAPHLNRNSARAIDVTVGAQLLAKPQLALLTRQLPEESAYYLPLALVHRQGGKDFIVIVDDRVGTPEKNLAAQLDGLAVEKVTSIPSSASTNRWHAYQVTLDELPAATTEPANNPD